MKIRYSLLVVFAIGAGLYFLNTATSSSAQLIRAAEPKSESAVPAAGGQFGNFVWSTVVNNSHMIPNGTTNFSSYGQPSVNSRGTVVFRGRSTGGVHETGMYMRKLGSKQIFSLADLTMLVPEPNNLETKFREFSSFPRIALNQDLVAFRGLHSPVYRYLLPDDTETRAGTTGIYVSFSPGFLLTGASKLGGVPGFEHYSVPMFKSLMFDVFPGGSAINDDGVIVFKGNWTEGGVDHKTGIFSRRLVNGPQGGFDLLTVLASSDTEIPNTPPMMVDGELLPLTFDSTSPPTVVGEYAIFLGLDNELDPHYGGIYRVPIKGGDLETLIEIGKPLPNSGTSPVIRLGEGLSWDGRYMAFWAAWGNDFKTIRLNCPTDGNADLRAYCNGIDPNSIRDQETGQWYQLHQAPVEQGIVVYDMLTGADWVVASTDLDFQDFLFWTYSGHVPGTDGDDDAEPPRWRSAAFMSVSDGVVAFKGRFAKMSTKSEYVNIVDGLYIVDAPARGPLTTVIQTGMDGALVDPNLSPNLMGITGLGLERDGFRGQHLAINVAMANAEAGWGGVYTTQVNRSPQAAPAKIETWPTMKGRK